MASSAIPDQLDVQAFRDVLTASRNPDGGWAYARGKTSRLEPTAWALLVLPAANADVLRKWPVSDNLLVEQRGGAPNYAFHAVGLLSLLARNLQHEAGNEQLIAALQGVRGVALEQSAVLRQNNALRGWSWIADTFSWVEPTAWSLLALKTWRRMGGAVHADRIGEAQALLLDRCCVRGGWNYGNSNVFGKDLKAYVSTTAIALLALHDAPTEPAVQRSLEYLERAAVSEPSGVALSLAFLALRVFDRDTRRVEAALASQAATTLALGNHLAVALTLAAATDRHGALAI